MPPLDIEEAATNKRVYMSGEGAVMRGGYNISVDTEVPKNEEVVRETIEKGRGFIVLSFQQAMCKW